MLQQQQCSFIIIRLTTNDYWFVRLAIVPAHLLARILFLVGNLCVQPTRPQRWARVERPAIDRRQGCRSQHI